jgi:inhibitor of KinA sporulation pathway (predicted exonuclease)
MTFNFNETNFLSLDLELNKPRHANDFTAPPIIQVGITVGNAMQSEEEWLIKSWYINPREAILPEITELTGITDAMVISKGVKHSIIAEEISDIINQYNCFVNPIVWGGNDSAELLTEFKYRNVHFPHFGRRWVDVKTFHTFIQLARAKNPAGGLSSAMGQFKMHFVGEQHRAEVDAYNTLRFFFNLVERQQNVEAALTLLKAL